MSPPKFQRQQLNRKPLVWAFYSIRNIANALLWELPYAFGNRSQRSVADDIREQHVDKCPAASDGLQDYLPTKGKVSTQAPKSQVAVGLTYSDGPIMAGVRLRWVASQYADLMNQESMPSYLHNDFTFAKKANIAAPTATDFILEFCRSTSSRWVSKIVSILSIAPSVRRVTCRRTGDKRWRILVLQFALYSRRRDRYGCRMWPTPLGSCMISSALPSGSTSVAIWIGIPPILTEANSLFTVAPAAFAATTVALMSDT
jgi:hypothetical protein